MAPPFAASVASPSSIKSSASKAYENAKDLAMEQIDRRNLKDALATLSVFYNAEELTTEQRQDLLDLLDALAREVVFSRQHTLDMAYVVAPGETLEQIAKRYDIPTDILARINALDTTAAVRSGEKLKVVPGPFRAEVDITRNELTLFVRDLYAGRYPVTFGSEPSPQPGEFQVVGKQKNRNYYGKSVQIPANDPRNPLGGYWIDLGQEQGLCIHGSSSSGPADSKLGCISLSPMDANDVYGMLSSGSQVTIRR
jgi:LysM repeat protein